MNDALNERLRKHATQSPKIHSTAYLAPQCTVIGDVHLGPYTSVWPQACIRGDINSITIGEGSNIQDSAVVHLADNFPTIIGKLVTIGHGATVHACTIEDECLIGIGATVLDGAVIGHHSIIAAHALVTPGTQIPPGSMVMGTPGKVVRMLSDEEQSKIRNWADRYQIVAHFYRENSPIFLSGQTQ
ncbi:MAG: gamma carbonic anhydrase family protein [Verrucomicrobia bacterium 21-51-4]|nr:MAG: gamma carbonic anhydrase family protein [Verrucomicrobia bacterium 21-51-4]HQU09305.1 gamma carbonic anhydrase family protein [Opitutales bacterium]